MRWEIFATAAAGVAAFVAGVIIRRRRKPPTKATVGWWVVSMDGAPLEVMGPFRNDAGEVFAMKPSQQIAWANDNNARLPTTKEFDQMWAQADVRVVFVPHDVVTAPLDAMNDSVQAALEDFHGGTANVRETTVRVVAAKTWLSMDDNYGAFVDGGTVGFNNEGVRVVTSGPSTGIKVYPTSIGDAFVIQPVSDFHAGTDSVDYSQLGYIVRDLEVA